MGSLSALCSDNYPKSRLISTNFQTEIKKWFQENKLPTATTTGPTLRRAGPPDPMHHSRKILATPLSWMLIQYLKSGKTLDRPYLGQNLGNKHYWISWNRLNPRRHRPFRILPRHKKGGLVGPPCRFAPDWARASRKKRACSSPRDEEIDI